MEAWPCKKSFSPAHEEKLRKDMMEGVCGVVRSGEDLSKRTSEFQTTMKGGLN
jgi:hypothetical protein